MRKFAVILLSLITVACQQPPSAPPPQPKMFGSRTEHLSPTDIAFLQEQTADFAPSDIAFYENAANADRRETIQKTLLESRTCVGKFQTPEADARVAIEHGDLRLYYGFSNGVVAYHLAPGVEHCRVTDDGKEVNHRYLGNPAFGDSRHYEIVDHCDFVMWNYAIQYNQTMGTLAPHSLTLSCGGSKRVRVIKSPPPRPYRRGPPPVM
jgi:hypothetical protein